MTGSTAGLDPTTQRAVASALFHEVWDYLERTDRTPMDDDMMIHAAHASCLHWRKVGGPEQWAIGEWQCSRVYADLGRGTEALWHARRCLDLCAEHGFENFIPASAHEALARAWCVLEDFPRARIERDRAYGLAVDLEDDDRGVIESDLATLPIPRD